MKNSTRYFILTLCLFTIAICSVVQAQWLQTNGPYGGLINCFAVNGMNLFVGTEGGSVFLSTNNGTSWTEVSIALSKSEVYALTVSGTNLFAGTYGGGVFLSTNNGTSWRAVNTGLTSLYVFTFVVNGSNLFAGTEGGVFLSTNNGASWTAVNIGLTNTNVRTLAVSGSNLFAGTWGDGVFLSTNNGTSWTAVNTGLTNTDVLALTVSGTSLFAGTYGGGVFLSTNNGTSWTAVNTGLTNFRVLTLAASGTNLFSGTEGGVFLSTNNGTSWTAANTGLTNFRVLTLAVSGTNLFAGTSNGVFLSTNNGLNWTAVNTGLTNTYIRALAESSTNLFAGTYGSGVFLSTDNGTSWTAGNTGLTNLYVFTFAVNGTNLFAGTYGGVFLSTDNGVSWTSVNSGLTNLQVFAFAVSGTNLFAGTWGGGVFRSTNNGSSWTAVNTGLTNPNVQALMADNTNLFAGTADGLFLSTNNGASWTAVNTGLTNTYISALAKSGANLFAGTWGGVFRSTNNGTSWVDAGMTNHSILTLAVSGKNLFAGTGTVWLSTDNGISWTPVNNGLTSSRIFALGVSGPNLFAGTEWQGVWHRPISEMITSGALAFQRGLNLLEWFDEPSAGQIQIDRYTMEDFQTIRAMGGEAVRVPIDLLNMAGPAPGYKLDPLLLEFLDLAVDRAEAAGLFIVLLNGSWAPVIGTDPTIEPILLATWTQMARHFKNRSKLVLYEVLNEPHGISDAVWNAMQERAIQAIRAEDGFHTIVVTPVNYSSCLNLDAMPNYSDDNLMYTFHFYDPYLFTHQGVTWGDPVPVDLVGVPFPYKASTMPPLPASLVGTWWQDLYNAYPQQGNEAWVKSQLDVAVRFQSERNVRLWCGEFGAYPPASPSTDRAAWTGIVRSYMEEKGIAWTFFTDWMFEKNTAGCFETDLDTMITSVLGLTAPIQKEPASEPETSGFTIYDDFIAHGLFESGWFLNGEYNLYSKESPYDGKSCLRIKDFEQYGNTSFRFCPFRDLSLLVNGGATLDFWIRCASQGTQIDIRFEDTKTSDPNDHPWRRSTMLNNSIVAWDGKWHHLSIPLKNFVESGSWDNNQWYNPQGLFDWKATDRFTIVAEHHSLNGIDIFFDNIRISDPGTNVICPDASLTEYQLQQNHPNPFNPSTVIRYRLPYGTNVMLTVYNTRGQQVAVLMQKYQDRGEHEVRFEGGSLAAGVYFYRLKAGNFEELKKLVLLR